MGKANLQRQKQIPGQKYTNPNTTATAGMLCMQIYDIDDSLTLYSSLQWDLVKS